MTVAISLPDADQALRERYYNPQGCVPQTERWTAASRLMMCRETEVLIEGPAGTGKSRAVLEKIHRACWKYPGMRALLVRKTRESMSESVLVTFENEVVPDGSSILHGASRRVRQLYEYPNGSTIVVGGMDKASRIMSTEYDLIAAFEVTELTADDWERLTTRLRHGVMPYQQGICDCNPDAPNHWLNIRASNEQMARLLSRHEDNPRLCDGRDWTPSGRDYIRRLDTLTGARKARLRLGQWAAAEGAVFEEAWDPARHIVDDVSRDASGDKAIKWYLGSIDWGYRDPGVILVWGIDGDRRMTCVRQIYRCQMTIDWWLEQTRHLTKEFQIQRFVADPSRPGYIEQLRRAGMIIYGYQASWSRAKNLMSVPRSDIETGLRLIEQRLMSSPPGLCYVRDATGWYGPSGVWLHGRDRVLAEKGHPTCAEDEFAVYAYEKDMDGRPTKERPADMYNHGLDSTRYGVAFCDRYDLTPNPIPLELPPMSMGKLMGMDKIFGPKPPPSPFALDND